jgi:hypothetical protein
MSKVHELVERLREIDWSGRRVPDANDLEKAKSYLDAVADLSRDIDEPISVLFNAAAVVGAETPEQRPGVPESNAGLNAYEAAFVRNAVDWAELCDQSHQITRGREGLYGPVLDLIERRVPLRLSKGYLFVGENAFPLHQWPTGYGVGNT